MKNSTGFLVFAAVALAGAASANEIYKWTDKDGNVHYGDRPTADSAEMLAVVSRPTDSEAVSAAVEARRERDAARSEARNAREEARQAEEEERRAAEAQAKRCEEYRARLETYLTSRRLYKIDENGNRAFLDEAQTQQARSDLQQRIQENCSN